MLFTNEGKAFYSKFASSPEGWIEQNKNLVARCVLKVYRLHGFDEARTLLAMTRIVMYTDKVQH